MRAVAETTAASRSARRRGRGSVDRHVGHDPARPRREHDDPVRDEDGLRDAVGDQHDGLGRPRPEAEQLEVESFAAQRIERAERLVEQEHRGLERERPGEGDPLPRAAASAPTADS